MISSQWIVDWSEKVERSLKKYRSDKPVSKSFKNAIKSLINEEDPAEIAYKKTPDDICIYWITKNVRLSYWMDYEKKIISFGNLGDHKEVHGWD